LAREASFVAEVLETSASAYAAAAAERLLEQHPATRNRAGTAAFSIWRGHLVQRILELASACAAGAPQLFVSRVLWSRKAMEARGLDGTDLRASIDALAATLAEILPENAKSAPLDALVAARAALDRPSTREADELDPTRARDRIALRYIQSVLEGEVRQAIEGVLNALEGGLTAEEAILRVLMPAQREIGRLWHLAQVSVAEEHLVTSTTQRLMAVIASRAPRRPDRGTTAVAAAVAGNAHDVGIRAIAYLLELDGWRSIYLGHDVPSDELPNAVHFFAADLVLLSSSLSLQLKPLAQTIAAIREQCDRPVKILVGGIVFRDAPDLWRELGADGYAAEAHEALRLAAASIPPA